MRRIPEEFVREVKERNNLSDVAASYMELKRRGKLEIGLCPFHGEKTPSFTIYTNTETYICFGCHEHGDVISFIMKIENLSYPEAVKFLAQRAGMALPEDDYDDSFSKLRTRIYEANREAARFFHQKLFSKEGKAALSYLHGRGLADSTIRHYGLGYALSDRFALSDHLREKGFFANELIAANLANTTKSGKGCIDRFSDRVMFPIIDVKGNVIAFGGRTMGQARAKYLNTSDTPVFNKSNHLYSLNFAKNAGTRRLILCEGYMDVIALGAAGFPEAVASLGTALTSSQANLMRHYADEVVICYDADAAGQRATQKAIEIIRNAGLAVRILTVPDGKDPDEFMKNHPSNGAAAFKNLLDNSGNDVEYRLGKLKQSFDMATPQGKMGYLRDSLKVLAVLDNPMERDIYMSKLSDETDVDKEFIKEQLNRVIKNNAFNHEQEESNKIKTNLSARDDKVNPEHKTHLRAAGAEERLLAFLLKNPDKLKFIESRLTPDDFVTDFNRRLYIYFSERIKSGKEPLATISGDFTNDERDSVVRIANTDSEIPSTMKAVNEYIDTILEESKKPTQEEISAASTDEITDMLSRMKEKKK